MTVSPFLIACELFSIFMQFQHFAFTRFEGWLIRYSWIHSLYSGCCSEIVHLFIQSAKLVEQAVGGRPPQYAPPLWPWPLSFWPWKCCRVTCDVGYLCANFSLPIGLSVLDLGPMYATDVRQTDVSQHHRLMPPPRGRGHNKLRTTTAVSEHSENKQPCSIFNALSYTTCVCGYN